MCFDPLNLLFSFLVFLIYASVCGIAIIFTFFPDIYVKIDEKLNLDVVTARVLTPLELNIDWFDDWLMTHNKIIGPILILLSMVDLKLFFQILSSV